MSTPSSATGVTPISQTTLPPGTALYEQIKSQLCAAIEQGEYQPESQLPSENELCERYGVSRSTVRQALSELTRAGLIYKVHGRGSFVARPRPLRNVASLEGLSEALSLQGHQVSNRLHSFRQLKADAELSRQLAVEKGAALAEIARVRLLADKPVSYEITVCKQSWGERLLAAEIGSRDLFSILENDHGVAISHADMRLNAVGAHEELAEILQVPQGHPLMRIQRTVMDSNQQPLLAEELYLLGDSLNYYMRVERKKS